MTDLPFILEAIKTIGFPALIFAIWYFYHKGQMKDHEMQRKEREKHETDEAQRFQQILDQFDKRHQQSFELMRDAVKSVQHHTMILARIENKIDNNQYCPYVPSKQQNRGAQDE